MTFAACALDQPALVMPKNPTIGPDVLTLPRHLLNYFKHNSFCNPCGRKPLADPALPSPDTATHRLCVKHGK